MGLFSKIKDIFAVKPKKDIIEFEIVCNKCGADIKSVYRKNYDLQSSYGQEEWSYLINKQLVCPGCYQSMKLRVEFDKNLSQIKSNLEGGKFVEQEKE